MKDSANFEGASTMTGRNTENAIIMNTSPAPVNAKKYANCCVEGMRYLHQGKAKAVMKRAALLMPETAWQLYEM